MKGYSARDRQNLSQRTPGEALWLARKIAGKTSYEAAAFAEVGRNIYRDAELDRLDSRRTAAIARVMGSTKPSLALLLRLARRRSGKGLDAVAKALKLSRVALLAAEGRGDVRVLAYWRARGFRFPVVK